MNGEKKILYSEPILNGQSSISAELQLAPEDSSGSLLTDVEKKLSDSLTAHAEPGRDRKRERELLSVHMFIHSQRSRFYVPTRSSLWLFPLPPTLPLALHCPWFAGYDVQVQVRWLRGASGWWRPLPGSECLPALCRGLFSSWAMQKKTPKNCVHQQFCDQLVLREPTRWWAETATRLGVWVHGRRGCLLLQWLRVCVKWSWKTTMDSWVPGRSHPETRAWDIVTSGTSVSWKWLCRGQPGDHMHANRLVFICEAGSGLMICGSLLKRCGVLRGRSSHDSQSTEQQGETVWAVSISATELLGSEKTPKTGFIICITTEMKAFTSGTELKAFLPKPINSLWSLCLIVLN